MKILHINWTFTFGGIETMLVNIANEQVKTGHNVHIIIIEYNSIEKTLYDKLNKEIKIHSANRKYGSFDLFALYELNKLIKTINPDTIHLHSSAIYKYIISPQYKKICNSTLHALCRTKNTNNIEKIPQVFAISQAVHDDLLKRKGVNSIVINNGINPSLIKFRKTEYYKDALKIVQVSRLHISEKGQDILIKAIKLLSNKGYNNISVDFIGDGQSKNQLIELVKELGLESKIRFLGAKSQEYIFNHLCDYNLFVQPSRFEGFGLTVAEAMAAKLPVIVSDNQGPAEVIGYGEYGYIFENENIEDCANKIEIFLKKENDLSQIENAYLRVKTYYNVAVTAQNYVQNYKKK